MRHRPLVFLGALALLPVPLALTQAQAQDPSPALEQAAAPAPEQAATPEPRDAQLERAEPLIARAEALYDAASYSAALAEFSRAYELLDGHPRRFEALYNIALCEQRLFHYDRALRYLRRYLEEGGADAPDRPVVQAAITALEGLLGTLRIASSTRAQVWVDDRLVGEAPGDVLIAGGSHSVELRAPGYESIKREINLPARATRELRFTLRPLARSQGLSPLYFWVASGASVAAVSVGVFFGVRALSEADAIERKERDALEQLTLLEDDGDAAGNAALTADILFGTAGVLAAGSVVLFLLTDFGDRAPPTRTASRMRVGLALDASGGAVMVRGGL